MLFHDVDVAKGGIHLWVNRKDKYMTQINGMMAKHAAAQAKEGLPVTADKNWASSNPKTSSKTHTPWKELARDEGVTFNLTVD